MKLIAPAFLNFIINGIASADWPAPKMPLRRWPKGPFSYPSGCTGEMKPKDEPFCAVGTVDSAPIQRVSIGIYIFDVEDTHKSTHLQFDMAIKDSVPIGLNVTGGGCARVADKKELHDAMEGVVTLCTEPVGDGVGHHDRRTGYWNAEFSVKADAECLVFGTEFNKISAVSKVVTAQIGPNKNFAFDASFEESTGDERNKGMPIAFDLTMNARDSRFSSWELKGAAVFHIWPQSRVTDAVELSNLRQESYNFNSQSVFKV
ncbi:hypothetical protein FOZ63_032060 [Perkinsus olseni]|uniref:Uncharacterized protein n=1 Tax=Perkinsus olseni TaxID=32597 RepID=A0A7J6SYM8_PEROL|nr:hypothetical protein FOZ63_032060 [Perkinsus olseni]